MMKGSKSEQEYQRKLKESLADEYIYDPETGTKLTLEEAESGHWIPHNNEFVTISESEIEKLPSKEERDAERTINYLKESKEYKKIKFTDYDLKLLEETKILSKYDDWSYSNSFQLEYGNGFILIPTVLYLDKEVEYFDNTYNESQIMFSVRLKNELGHYYLREKTSSEHFFDMIKNDDDLKLKNYESFTFKKSKNVIQIMKILEAFKETKGLEIEIKNNNLFFKSTKFINKDELLKLEIIAKNVC